MSRRLHWLVLGVALFAGIAAGFAIAVTRSANAPASPVLPASATDAAALTWPAGKKLAPEFSLRDELGKPISLRQFRGRSVILTFIDPLCRSLCPFEAKTLDKVAASFPSGQRPAIVAVSTNHWADARKNFVLDKARWKLPSDWHWAVGTPAALARVWKAYYIGVSAATQTIAGIKVHRITHTEASYVLDPRGYERSLFVYPFLATSVERTLRSLPSA